MNGAYSVYEAPTRDLDTRALAIIADDEASLRAGIEDVTAIADDLSDIAVSFTWRKFGEGRWIATGRAILWGGDVQCGMFTQRLAELASVSS